MILNEKVPLSCNSMAQKGSFKSHQKTSLNNFYNRNIILLLVHKSRFGNRRTYE